MLLLFFILSYFLLFYPPSSPKNQNLKKMKKIPWDIIILHIHTKNYDQMMHGSWKIKVLEKMPGNIIILHLLSTNDDHMMYGSWDMECNRQNFFSFWTIFLPFYPLTTQKMKILKKWKKCQKISSIQTSVP